MDSLYSSEKARRKQLPPVIRRLIVDLEAEYPPFNTNEVANIVRLMSPLTAKTLQRSTFAGGFRS
jgi:hypothetical protein